MKNVNGKLWKIIALAMAFVLAAMGAVYGYGRLNGRFEAVETEIKKVNENENAIIGMQKDIEHIKEAVDKSAVIIREIEKKL